MNPQLPKLPIFSLVDPATVERLTRSLPRKQFKKGELLLRQGKKELRAHLLIEGKVGVYAESPDGRRTTILFHEAPYILGELEIWRERANLGSVEAITPCTTLVLTKKAFFEMLQSNHQVCINLARMLSDLLYRTGRDRRVRMFGRVEHLVASSICSFAQISGENSGDAVVIPNGVNKSQIAEILGIARRSVLRAFDQLEEEKLIEMRGRALHIPNIEALRQKANAPFPDFLE